MFKFLLISTVLLSQVVSAGDVEMWFSTSIEQKLDEKYSVYGEFIYRHSREKEEFKVLSNRLGLIRTFENKMKAAFINEVRSTDSSGNNESRNILQASRKFNINDIEISARLRWELRKFADSPVTMNRFRLFLRADFPSLELASVTPYIAVEEFLITNRVGGRPAGSSEFRGHLGLSTAALGGEIELAYMFREQIEPAFGSTPKDYSMFHILNTSLKYTF